MWPPVPRIWRGETACIIASGPSATKDDAEKVKGKAKVLTVNLSYRLAPWADAMYACDWAVWNKYADTSDVDGGLSWRECNGIKISQDATVLKEFPGEVVRVPSVREPGLSLDPLRIHQGANSGYQALNLAVLMGAKRILLLGYDMMFSDKKHWHGDHESGLNNPQEHNLDQWRENFETTLPDLEKAGVEVINCSRRTALECFPKMKLEDALC